MLNDFHLEFLLIALVADWYMGEPPQLWSRVPHPIALFGKAISFADKHLNNPDDSDELKYKKGGLAIVLLLLLTLAVALILMWLFSWLGWFSFIPETFILFVFLAQKSLYDHVKEVATGLRDEGLDGGREAASMIVGRDTALLDKSGVCRASIESLAENFSDGVVAPAFWYLIFGLPGLLVYKMINTADSMIGYKNEKYLWFGRVAAQIDDLANWLPARLSAFIIALGVLIENGMRAAKDSLLGAMRDAGLHRSPNAGWPEAAMAYGTGIALGGPRIYPSERVEQAWLNGAGKHDLSARDIDKCLKIFAKSCYALWGGVVILGVITVL